LISRSTYECVANSVVVGKSATTPVKGRVKPVQVYEVLKLNS
jgi:class 3 adenylate cyclase